ncbi:tRNA uridine-5-carboxymethylaminomethyl(34) synthesis enzyme MnmG [Helicobacter suis]|uniref:tRNA uridine 5-carboxymethylaminomethyl modification enzyme MnmG n=1 Tax=Helicobacter suis TaxID=104628 RepID=A0A6J4CYC2_9HELI|nr:tRNA uridine-5-carboxymethylaminomethyl(34) synthesis enzyme MnmG [Helicobacter suis]BCD69702.1 tRNA uridine 5-carboxymethylaminomethyl modification enzyme GidA [Helicobacter suis]
MLDIVVVGGGHAGIEASIVAAKMGAKVHLLTLLIENIGLASCNPAIGGLGKGHLVKEIDALGGVMGILSDLSGLQFRILNASKGPAVRGTRAQIDMDLYRQNARNLVLNTSNLSVSQEMVEGLLIENGAVVGVKSTLGKEYKASKVILTTGTFLQGLVHIGTHTSQNGRFGESASIELAQHLKTLGLEIGRLKTGTCPRLAGNSIDFTELEAHFGDFPPPKFSHKTKDFNPIQLPCFITYTNSKTHALIEQNFHLAPMFSGQIEGVGPRYCPSIEDKIYRFKDKERHQLFLEPQTKSGSEYYVNGLSTSLPFHLQEQVIHSIKGLEHAHITRYGYAIEYDFIQPTGLEYSLESKQIKNLYLAGQINGTTGYEEAAAQGLLAGINACLTLQNKPPLILRRDEAYIGVMIDDLVSKGTQEPYRMFTSRAEYRLLLREDNARWRLCKYAYALGLMSEKEHAKLQKQQDQITKALENLKNTHFTPSKETLQKLQDLGQEGINDKCNGVFLAGRDSCSVEILSSLFSFLQNLEPEVLEQVKIACKYHSYIEKQSASIARMEQMLQNKIPSDFVFHKIPGLGLEAIEKLERFRPKSLFEASQISGITPSNLEVLQLYLHLHTKTTLKELP